MSKGIISTTIEMKSLSTVKNTSETSNFQINCGKLIGVPILQTRINSISKARDIHFKKKCSVTID